MKKATTYTPPQNIEEAIAEAMPSANKLVRKFTKTHYHLREDYMQEAMLAICKAWEKYDNTKSNKFSTFAHFWIFAHVKDRALERWDEMNNEQEFNLDWHDKDGYTINDNFIDITRSVEKFSNKHQVVFERRMEGYTFDEIANQLGLNNLQQARNMYMEVQQQLEE